MYESMVFYRSFYEAVKGLDAETQATIYDAIFAYGLDGEEPELSGVALAVFTLIKPQIDANNRRKENGKKGSQYGKLGGRPKKENPKQTPRKPLENPKQTPNVNVNANVNVNDININQQSSTPIAVEFDQLWQMYPKKEGRKEAHLAYERARKKGITYEEVKAGIVRYNNHIAKNRVQRQYIMQGSTFFRGERWSDDWKDNQQKPTAFSNFAGREYKDETMLKLIQM